MKGKRKEGSREGKKAGREGRSLRVGAQGPQRGGGARVYKSSLACLEVTAAALSTYLTGKVAKLRL